MTVPFSCWITSPTCRPAWAAGPFGKTAVTLAPSSTCSVVTPIQPGGVSAGTDDASLDLADCILADVAGDTSVTVNILRAGVAALEPGVSSATSEIVPPEKFISRDQSWYPVFLIVTVCLPEGAFYSGRCVSHEIFV